MEMSAAERCREGAAGEVLARIRGDSRRVTGRVRTVLGFIERWLFEEKLTLAGIRRGCGIKDTGFGEWFRAEVGVSPGRYVRERRLEVAARMLVGSRLEVGLICQLVGFTLPQTFTKAFRRWAGMSPSVYRARHQSVAAAPAAVGREVWEWGVAGRLPARQAEAVAGWLWERYWGERGVRSVPPLFAAVEASREEVEEVKAAATWEVLREASAVERGELVRGGLGFTTPALYERLHRASREVGREDRLAGVALARLAVDCLGQLAPFLEMDELLRLRAHGWGWVGNAWRNALDFVAAEEAFATAEEFLAEMQRECPEVRADLLDLESGLRLFQRRYGEALDLASRAIAVLRGQRRCDRELLARILLRRVDVQRALGRYSDALMDIREVMALLNDDPVPELELIACQHLCVLLIKFDLLTEAAEVLPRARKLAAELSNGTFDAYLDWSEALLRQREGRVEEAEALFGEAREGFRQVGDGFYVAGVGLDLAMLCLSQNRVDEAMTLAEEALPVFEQLAAHPEALTAIRLLRQAARHEELTQALLDEVSACLEKAWDPRLLHRERPRVRDEQPSQSDRSSVPFLRT